MSYNYNLLRDLWKVRKKTREEDNALNTVPIQQRQSFSFQLLFMAAMFMLFGASNTFAQTTIINPAAEGGFENGATFQANGWTTMNDDLDEWYVGNVQTPASGTKGAYVSSTDGKSFAYTAVQSPAQVSFFYRDVTVPAGENKITLSFKWKNFGKDADTGDRIMVFAAPTTLTPIASQLPAGAVEITPNFFNTAIGLDNNPDYRTDTYYLPKSYAGTTFRLIFAYRVGAQGISGSMPGAIDDISLVSQVPSTVKSIASGNWSDPTIWDSGKVPQNDNVLIDTGHTVKIDKRGDYSTAFDILTGSVSTNNLTVNGTLTYGEVPTPGAATARIAAGLQIYGNLVVNQGGNFSMFYIGVLSSSKIYTYSTFSVSGDVTNNGYMDIYQSEMILPSANVQTIGGTGVFANSTTSSPTDSSTYSPTLYVTNLRLRNSNGATPNVIWNFDTKISSILEMKQARVNLGTKVVTLGVSPTAPSNNFPVTDDAGFTPGSKFVRFWSIANTGFSISTTPNTDFVAGSQGIGKYPFVNAKGENRSVFLQKINTAAAMNGEIGMTYNDASTYTTGLSVADGTTTITNRFDGNWTVTDSGVGPFPLRVAIEAPGVLTTTPNQANNAVRIMHANGVFGTFLPGNRVPTAIRDNITIADLTAGPLYLGAAATDLIPATTVTSVTSGNWNAPATWSNSHVPTKDDVVTITSGTTVTVNSPGNVSKNVNIAFGGTLLNVSGDLTIGVTLNNNLLNNNGTLNVSGGTLNINGSSVHNIRSTFIQSGGDIIVDGSDGTTANSVATTIPMMKIYATTPDNLQWTGGTLTFVDPHAGTAFTSSTGGLEYVLTVNQYGGYNSATRNHTVKFGDGISTTPAGTQDGFRFYLKPDSNATTAPFRLGSVVVNGGNDPSRMVKPMASGGLNVGFEGDVTITSGTLAFPSAGTTYFINGSLVNNGTLMINQGSLHMGMERAYYNQTVPSGAGTLTAYFAPCPNAQSIEGTGRFLSTIGTPAPETVGLNTIPTLVINNSSTSGVTLKVPLTIVNNNSQGTLTLMQGKLNTDNTNLLTLGTTAIDGTVGPVSGSVSWLGNSDTYINGPFARYIKTNTSATYNFFPVGKSRFLPFSIAPTITVPTNALAFVKVEAIESNSGTADGTTCSNLAPVRWETTSSVPFSTSNVKLGDANIVSGMIPVQSTSAAGTYSAAFGNTSIFTTTAPNTIATSFPAVAANYFSYGKLATCNGAPTPGLAVANGLGNAIASGALTGVLVSYAGPIELNLQNAVLSEGQTYQWEGSADNITYTAINGLTTALAYTKQDDAISYYRCKITCGGTTATSAFVAVSVVAPTLVWSSTSVCPGASATITSVSNFNTATSYCALFDGPEGSGNLISYNTSSNTFSTGALTTAKTFYVAVIDKATGRTSKRVAVTSQVSAVPAAPTAIDQTFCNSALPDAAISNIAVTGTGINWYAAPTGGAILSPTATVLANGTTYYASQTVAGCESTQRAPVVATVIAAPTAAATTQGFCNSGTVANLVATAPQGGTIKWYSATTNGNQWASTDALASGTYFASQTVGACETRRIQITVNVGTSTPAAPTSTAPTPSYCSTAGALLSTPVVTGATGSIIKYYDVATGGSLVPSTTVLPVGSSTYYVSQVVGGCESTARLMINPTVNFVDAPFAAASQSVCGAAAAQGPALLAASPNPTTATALFKLYNVATGGSALASGSPVNGATYYVSQTINGCEGALRAPVLLSVSNPLAPTIASTVNVCNVPAATIASLTAMTTTSLPGSTIKWYQSSTVKLPTDPLAATSYSAAEITAGGCESATRANCTVTLGATVPAAPTVIQAGSLATGATVANLSATGININPTTNATINWYSVATGGSPLASTTPLVDGASYYATQTATGCESPRSVVVASLGATLPGAPTPSPTQTFCLTAHVSDLLPASQGSNIINWYQSPTGGSPLPPTAPLSSQTTYYASLTANGAEGIQRAAVYVYVNSLPIAAPTATATQSFCSSTATVADLTANGTGIKWYDAVTGGNLVPSSTLLTTRTLYPTQTYNTCETLTTTTRNAVNVVVTTAAPGAPTLVAPQTATPTVCYGATVANLSVTGVTGSTINWYDAPTGGNLLASTAPVMTTVPYYASQMIGSAGCESARLMVTPTVSALINAPTAAAAQTVCPGTGASSLVATGLGTNTIKWYTSATGTALASATLANSTYFATDSNTTTGCESTTRTPVLVTVVTVGAPIAASPQAFCNNSATVGNLVANGLNIQWYSAATGGTPISTSTPLTAGTYYPTQMNGTCETPSLVTRNPVTVTVTPTVTQPSPAAAQTICIAANASAAATGLVPAPSTTVRWYTASTGGTALVGTDVVTSNTYYVTAVTAGCESTRVPSVVTVATKPTAPVISSITHPTCTVSTGSVTLTGLPATGTWALTPGTLTGTGTSYTITGVGAGAGRSYTVTDSNGCTVVTPTFTINSNPTVTTPTIAITQPTCSVSTGSVTFSGMNPTAVGIFTPGGVSSGTTRTFSGLAPGSYSYTFTNQLGCTSAALPVVINVGTPAAPVLGTVTQPTCTTATGSFAITNYDPTYTYTFSPTGPTISGGTVTALPGQYTVTATLGSCTSVASVMVAVNAQPTTLTVPDVAAKAQPTCTTPTGIFVINNYDPTYTYAFSTSTGLTNNAGSVTAPSGPYTVTATLGTCTSPVSASVTINAQPATPAVPLLGSVTQPTCTTATGSFAITNYDSSYTYAFTPSTGVTRTGATVTAPTVVGGYTVIATLGACTSAASSNAIVSAQPTTLAVPTLGTVTQPTCTVATGSFAITNYDSSYTYAFTPSTGVTRTGATVTAPTVVGGYTVIATLGACTSVASANAAVNAQPTTLVQPAFGSVTQPTCTVATGSFAITNYDTTYTYAFTPSTGVTRTGAAVTAPTVVGGYTVIATLGTCTSTASASAAVNAQPATPAVPLLGSVTQPTCTVSTGSFGITNYNSSYTYTFSPSTGVTNNSGAVTAPAGKAYTVTATLGTCISATSGSAAVNVQPTTLVQPTFGSVTQPTCAVSTGSFAITNYDASYTYAFSGSSGATRNAAAVTAPANGSYAVTASLGTCTSTASASATVNAQPTTPAVPLLGSVTQPTCAVSTGSFAISNYDTSYTYAFTPSTGVTRTGATVTAPTTVGGYTVTASNGTCTSAASASAAVNAQPATPTAPSVGTITQPTADTQGSVVLSGLPAGNWTIAQSGTVSNTITGSTASTTVSGLAQGTYTFTVSNGTCTSIASASVVINAPVIPAPAGTSPQMFAKSATVSDLVATPVPGATVLWYATPDASGTPLAADAPLVVGTTYYAVQVINGYKSATALAVQVASSLAVDQFNAVKMDYYPNPVIDVLNITHTNVISSIEVYNLLGQRVLTARPNSTSTKMDMSDLPVGTYLLEVQSEGKMTTVKVVKNQQ